ncbi:MAG: hypothetical protein ACHQTE_00295 [Candidatus Saccharimonadales bacterium]
MSEQCPSYTYDPRNHRQATAASPEAWKIAFDHAPGCHHVPRVENVGPLRPPLDILLVRTVDLLEKIHNTIDASIGSPTL